MAELNLCITARTARDIEALARSEADRADAVPLTVEEMASALLEAHMTLIRDCGDILPTPAPHPKPGTPSPRKTTGLGGVSLGGGINGRR